MRVVIDTNIIVAALLSGKGKSRTFMNRVFGGEYEVIVSETILSEYERVFHYPKLGLNKSTISFVLDWFRTNAIFIEINEDQPVPEMDERDKTDKPFYLLARSTKSLLVTGNIKHYPVEEWRTMIWELV